MKVAVIYGDDNAKCWERLKKIEIVARKRGWEISKIEPNQKLSVSEYLSSGSLFAKERLFIIESGKSLTKKDLVWLTKNCRKLEGYVAIYFSDSITQQIKGYLPKDSKFEEYKLPKIIFKFLDGIYPGNSKNSVIILHRLLRSNPAELIFNLVAKRFNELYWAKNSASTLDYPAWRKEILKRQSSKYSDEQLMKVISLLAEADIRSKTGDTDIIHLLDLIILTHLE